MPLLNKKPFEPHPVPTDVAPDTEVFFSESSNEIFTNYDDFFDRMIELNSTQWSCEYTGKGNLTFDEALRCEQDALKTLGEFPQYLEIPLLFIIKNYTCRGRFNDLVEDMAIYMKDRFFTDEECILTENGKKRNVKVISSTLDVNAKQPKSPTKNVGPDASSYSYVVSILDKGPDFENERTGVKSSALSRTKQFGSRQKLKIFIKNACALIGNRYTIKEQSEKKHDLESITWNDIFCGNDPTFPSTPMQQRGRQPKQSLPASVPSTPTQDGSNKKPGKPVSEKKKQKIIAQQEEYLGLFESAKKFNIDVSNYQQTEKLLTPYNINELKTLVKAAREQDREANKEARKLKKAARSEWSKKRDDLECDDLQPLPPLDPLELPSFITGDEFAHYLTILQFFNGFLDLLPVKEVRGTSRISLSDVVIAIRCNDPQESSYADLMKILLSARTDRSDEEDGDEADLDNRDEIYLMQTQNCDPVHPEFGERIREATVLHRETRKIHGEAVRHLPIDWMTLSEVLRLVILTSGYYTGLSTHRHRLFPRGYYRGYEDPGFTFATDHPNVVEKLRVGTVFDLTPTERLDLMLMLIYQLLSYSKFRSSQEERITQLFDHKRELKKLRQWDISQEQDAKEARLVREYEIEQISKGEEKMARAEPGETSLRLKAHFRSMHDSRRVDKDELEEILLSGVAFSELELDEIVFAREQQREKFLAIEEKLLNSIYDLSSVSGQIYLGRDRAFRNYFMIETLPAILVETATDLDRIGTCIKATPLVNISEFESEEHAYNSLLACSGNSDDCPVHSEVAKSRTHWSIINDVETIDKIIAACNPRGFREIDLQEELSYYKSRITEVINKMNTKKSSGQFNLQAVIDAPDPNGMADSKNWQLEMRELLLDLEEKINQGLIGQLPESVNRDSWREMLLETGDITSTVTEDIIMRGEVIVEHAKLPVFNEIQKLSVAFLQLVNGINYKFIKQPFTNFISAEGTHTPTTCFVRWQKGLMECASIPALSLFLSTLEPNIMWDKSRLQGKCRSCRRKGAAEDLVLCTSCDKCYHFDCIHLPRTEVSLLEFVCRECVALKKKQEAADKRKALKEKEELENQEEEEMDENSVDENLDESDVTRTSSGRAVKKVTYKEKPVSTPPPPLKSSRRHSSRTNGSLLAFDNDDDDSESETPVRVSKRLRKEVNDDSKDSLRSASTGLRDQDTASKEKMSRLEQSIKDSMKLDVAWPFLEPVSEKDVPDYYDIIKKPIDLRTMMNKIKNHKYDSPEEVREDMKLLIANCKHYNEEKSEIYQCAEELDSFFRDVITDIFENKRRRR